MSRVLIVLASLCCFQFGIAQPNVRDSLVAIPMLIPVGGVHAPLGDIQERYKVTYHIGGEFIYKHKSNWIWGVSGRFMFGENVGEPRFMIPLVPIIARDGSLPSVSLGMRGMCFMAIGGKIIPVGSKPNRNSGIMLNLGLGYLQHKIYIDVRGDLTPQASGEYIKGYDRLTDGLAFSQFVGYIFMGNNRRVNFIAGLESIMGFTKNRRGYNYDTFQYDTGDKFDVFLGLKVGWVFGLYGKGRGPGNTNKGKEREFIYE